MSASTDIARQIAADQASYQQKTTDLAKQSDILGARYGVNAAGALDFIDPKDPFSVTGAAKRLFREQADQSRYGAFAGGYGFDGAAGEKSAHLQIAQAARRRDITDSFDDAKNDIVGQRVRAAGDYATNRASLQAQLAEAFAAEPTATLGAAAPVAAAPGEAGPAAVAPGAPRAQQEYKRAASKAHGGQVWIYSRPKGSTGAWVPVRAA